MKRINVHNLSRPDVSPVRTSWAKSFFSQLRGLTFRRSIPYEEGLLLVQTHDSRIDTSIHMLGVLTDLAVVWINSDLMVVDVRLARKWHPAYIPARPARYVLEMNPARLDEFHPGDRLRFEDMQP
jgi:uncharacterized membrane protein (UPF0127 family)